MNYTQRILLLALSASIAFAGCSSGTDSYEADHDDFYDDSHAYEDTETGDSDGEESGRAGMTPWDGDDFIEPLTGARVTLPAGMGYQMEISGTYGMITSFSDLSDSSGINVQISVEEVYAEKLEDACDLDNAFAETIINGYAGNYLSFVQAETSFDEMVYSYHQFCLLTDGSILHVSAATSREDSLSSLTNEVTIDFTDAYGQLGLMDVDQIPIVQGMEDIRGIWGGDSGDRWLDCRGGALFSLYDGAGNLLDCGVYDDFWETLEGANGDYGVVLMGDTVVIGGETFAVAERLGIVPADRPAGIPSEGTAGSDETGDALTPFLGQWRNDTIAYSMEINRGSINLQSGYSVSSSSYTLEDGYLKSAEWEVRLTDDGGLTISTYDGVFYREGERDNPMTAYVGAWYNEATGEEFRLDDDGGAVYTHPTEDGGIGFEGGSWLIIDDGVFTIIGSDAYLDANGDLVVDGCDGVFKKEG